MATAVHETIIVNPAKRKKHKRNASKRKAHMTRKQLKYFGTKRQRAAAKKRRSNTARKTKRSAPKRHRARTAPRRKTRTRRSNPGAIYALVNPGRRSMAKRKTHKRRHRNPGKTTVRRHRIHRSRRRSNPGAFGRPMEWLELAGGVVIGATGASTLPNLLMGASNTGIVGYLSMAAVTGILAWAGHAFLKKPSVTSGIIGGGGGAIVRRVIQDYSLLGSYSASLGMGDILTDFSFLTPQTVTGLQRPYAQTINPGTGMAPAPMTPVNVGGANVTGGKGVGAYLY